VQLVVLVIYSEIIWKSMRAAGYIPTIICYILDFSATWKKVKWHELSITISNYSVRQVMTGHSIVSVEIYFYFILYFKASVSAVSLASFRVLLIVSFIHTAFCCVLSTC